jgi:hypothetical protein
MEAFLHPEVIVILQLHKRTVIRHLVVLVIHLLKRTPVILHPEVLVIHHHKGTPVIRHPVVLVIHLHKGTPVILPLKDCPLRCLLLPQRLLLLLPHFLTVQPTVQMVVQAIWLVVHAIVIVHQIIRAKLANTKKTKPQLVCWLPFTPPTSLYGTAFGQWQNPSWLMLSIYSARTM